MVYLEMGWHLSTRQKTRGTITPKASTYCARLPAAAGAEAEQVR